MTKRLLRHVCHKYVSRVSFQGSALERTAPEAPPRELQAEPAVHWVPSWSLGTS
jgi:hypothetical protein